MNVSLRVHSVVNSSIPILAIHCRPLDVPCALQAQPNPAENWSAYLLATLRLPNIMAEDVPGKPLDFYTCPFRRSKIDRWRIVQTRVRGVRAKGLPYIAQPVGPVCALRIVTAQQIPAPAHHVSMCLLPRTLPRTRVADEGVVRYYKRRAHRGWVMAPAAALIDKVNWLWRHLYVSEQKRKAGNERRAVDIVWFVALPQLWLSSIVSFWKDWLIGWCREHRRPLSMTAILNSSTATPSSSQPLRHAQCGGWSATKSFTRDQKRRK